MHGSSLCGRAGSDLPVMQGFQLPIVARHDILHATAENLAQRRLRDAGLFGNLLLRHPPIDEGRDEILGFHGCRIPSRLFCQSFRNMQAGLNPGVPRPLETLAQRLRLARRMRKLSQAHLAERAGLKQSDISKIENGKISKTTAMARLSHVLRVPAAWLELNEGQEPDWSDDSEPPKASAEPGERDALLERMLIAYKAILPTDRANYVAQMERRAGEIREIEKRLRERAGHELLNPVVHQPAGSVGKKGKLS